MSKGARYLLELEAVGPGQQMPGLRRLLKALLRRYGLRAVSIVPVDQAQATSAKGAS